MKLAIITLAAAAAVSTVAVAAKVSPLGEPPAPGTGLQSGQCIRTTDIRNHTVVDNKTILIDVRNRGTYRVTTNGYCFAGASSSDPIVTRSPPGTQIACKPIDFDIGVLKGGFTHRCIVDSVVKLSPEELATLPPKLKP